MKIYWRDHIRSYHRMAPKAKDYSKSVVYKICCRDPSITDCYVGSTTNLVQRRSTHKRSCNNPSHKSHHLRVYEFVRQHGGWENWQVVPIEEYPCDSISALEIRENHWFSTIKPSLNVRTPGAYAVAGGEPEYKKQRYVENKEERSVYDKQYYAERKDKILEKQKQYYAENRDKILEKITCECGAVVSRQSLPRHRKRAKHQRWLQSTSTQTSS